MNHSQGFSILEALCALLLLNLLGVGLLHSQWQAMQAQRDALAYQNALDMAQDLWQRMQLNHDALGHYQLAWTDKAIHGDCHAQACTPAQWAQADLADWQRELQVRMPGAQSQLTADTVSTDTPMTTISLTLAWPSAPNLPATPMPQACPPHHRCWQTTWHL